MAKSPGFNISGIQEIAYWFRMPKGNLPEEESLHFSVENNFGIHTETNTIEVMITISVNREKVEPTSKRPPLLNYQVAFTFEVGDLDTTVHPDKESGYEYIQLPKGLSVALISTAYSTCRGLLFARSAGSALQDYLLPIANPVELSNNINDRIRRKTAQAPPTEVT